MDKKRAYSFIEILIVLAITLILTGLFFSIYKNFLQEQTRQSVSIKKEMDLGNFLIYLEKTISSAGFGISKNDLYVWTSANCNNLSGFINATAFVGIAKNCSVNVDELYIKSLSISSEKFAGCWWAVNKSQIKTQATDKRGSPCNFTVLNSTDECVVMNYDKENATTINCGSVLSASKIGLIFYKPDDIAYRFYLNPNDSKECAPSTYTFLRQSGNSQPLFDCIGGFKVKYIKKDGTYVDTITDVGDLYGIKICLLIQVSGKMRTPQDVPTSSGCGNFTLGSSEWKFYRWRVIEEDIPFENL